MRGHTVDGQPLILILALRKLHHLAKTPPAKGRLGILTKLVAGGTAFAASARPELIPRPLVTSVCPS